MRRLAYAGTAAAFIALIIWVFLPQPPIVETGRVTRGDLTVRIAAEGDARIREVVVISAPIFGLLQRISLHPGDEVATGDSVAQIGPAAPALLDARARAVAEASAAAAAAAVELARSQVAQAEALRDFARSEADRARILYDRDALSQRVLDDAVLSERTAAAATTSARANLAVREKELQSARAVLQAGNGAAPSCCVDVKAPGAGRILRVLTEDERVVQAGTPILEIGDAQDMEVVAHVLSSDAVQIAPGAKAIITGWGGEDLAARVERVEPSATTRISALGVEEQRVEVRLALEGIPPQGLGHGFRVTARIAVWEGRNVLQVPIAALMRIGGDWAVYAQEDGRAILRRVTLGARNDMAAAVLSGLEEGAEVILHPSDTVVDGGRVTP